MDPNWVRVHCLRALLGFFVGIVPPSILGDAGWEFGTIIAVADPLMLLDLLLSPPQRSALRSATGFHIGG